MGDRFQPHAHEYSERVSPHRGRWSRDIEAPSERGVLGWRLVALLAVVVAGVLVVGVASASAVKSFPRLGEITGPAPGESFGRLDSESVAVNDFNKHVLVADSSIGVVYDFRSALDTHPAIWTGSEEANPPGTVAGSFGEGLISVAVDDETGDVYVADTANLAIDKLDASGHFISSFDGSATPAKSFSHPNTATPLGIAVDQVTHDVYVIDSGDHVVDVFSASGVYEKQITEVPLGLYECGGQYTDGIAVNASSGHVFVSDSCTLEAFEFEALGLPLKTWTGSAEANPPGTPAAANGEPPFGIGFTSVAVNATSGDVYLTDSSHAVVDQFNGAGEYLAQITGTPSGEGGGVAVDQATGEVYVSDNASSSVKIFGGAEVSLPDVGTGPASSLAGTSVTLNGSVNPEGVEVSDCHFEYVDEAHYQPSAFDPYSAGSVQPCVETVGSGTTAVAVHADLTSLQAETRYHFRLVASNTMGPARGQDQTFAALRPSVDAVSFENLAASSVSLNAMINPNGLSTNYRFEYGTSTAYGTSVPVPDADIGAGTAGVSVTQNLTGLIANVTYHWRVVAANTAGTTTGPDHTFLYGTSGGGLPDNRSYEMVTPPQKNGAFVGRVGFTGRPPDVSEAGSRLISMSVQCFAGAESCTGDRATGPGTPYAFTRTSGGWVANSLAPPATHFENSSFWRASADAGTALFSIPTVPHGEDDLYAREADGSFAHIGPVTPPELGGLGPEGGGGSLPPIATADLSHIVYHANAVHWSFDATLTGQYSLYESTGAGDEPPVLVGVSGGVASTELISVCQTVLGGDPRPDGPYALSTSGKIVYFTASACEHGSGPSNEKTEVSADTLYARVNESETVKISEHFAEDCKAVECQGSPPAAAQFEAASADGLRVFFLSTQQLTDEASEGGGTATGKGCSSASGAGCNLYEGELGEVQEGANRKTDLKRLTAVSGGDSSGGGPRVQGAMAISSDGSHVYFVAKGVLTTAPNAQGQSAVSGGENLYVSERDATYPQGRTIFIATLSAANCGKGCDPEQWEEGVGFANVTPDGRFLVFRSQARLTADDTSSPDVAQVFRYDALTGDLVRVSIGERGFNDNGNAGTASASIVQADTAFGHAGSPRGDPTMSHDGSYVFFESPVGLTPQALNEAPLTTSEQGELVYAQNVYEYHEGHVYLISDGKDTGLTVNSSDVELIGSDATGANVFFGTSDPLVPADTDTQVDVYDARICSKESPCIQPAAAVPPPCLGEACHGTPATTPAVAGVPTASFEGAGNLVPPSASKAKTATEIRVAKLARALRTCRAKRNRHRRAMCEAQARRKYHGKPSGKGSRSHRLGRLGK